MKRSELPEGLLMKLYWDKEMTTSEICKEVKCSPATLIKSFRRYDIPVRHKHEGSETITCDYCGTKIRLPCSRIKKTKYNFCSLKCHGKWKSRHCKGKNNPSFKGNKRSWRVTVKCDWCGREYKQFRYRLERSKHHFCSIVCANEWHKGKHYSPETEFTFIRVRGENNPHWRGGYEPYYGPNWEEARRKALERDNICKICGSNDRLSVHHIVPFREFGRERCFDANNLDNLITLCVSCHSKVTFNTLEVNEGGISKA